MKHSIITCGAMLRVCCLAMGFAMAPRMLSAATVTWTNSIGGAWENAANWGSGGAPGNTGDVVYITNTLSKTVMINPGTPTGSLTISRLYVEAPAGYTNTLLLSSNASPLEMLGSPPISLGDTTNRVGDIVVDSGWLVTSSGNAYVGRSGVGEMTVQSGNWLGYAVQIGANSNSYGRLNLYGGTNTFTWTSSPFVIGNTAGSVGRVTMTNGMLVTSNGSSSVGLNGGGTMDVSGGTWLANTLNVGGNTGSDGRLNLSGGTINLFATSTIGNGAGSTGTVVMTGGQLISSNGTAYLYVGFNGIGNLTVSNGTWATSDIRLGSSITATNTAKGTLIIAGGLVKASGSVKAGSSAGASNHTVCITGGLLDANTLACANGGNNTISNAGGVYQFSTLNPTITTSGGPVVINGGTISFRDVTTVNVTNNLGGTQLTNMTFTAGSQNAFRLNNATNATLGQSYTFSSTPGGAVYARLELVSNACYRGGNVTIGNGGSILFSNATALLTGSLTNHAGTLTVADSTATILTNCTLAEGSTFNWFSKTADSRITVNGTLTLPTNATFCLSSPLGRADELILFSSPHAIVGSPAKWATSPESHRLWIVDATNLVLRPRLSGFVFGLR